MNHTLHIKRVSQHASIVLLKIFIKLTLIYLMNSQANGRIASTYLNLV